MRSSRYIYWIRFYFFFVEYANVCLHNRRASTHKCKLERTHFVLQRYSKFKQSISSRFQDELRLIDREHKFAQDEKIEKKRTEHRCFARVQLSKDLQLHNSNEYSDNDEYLRWDEVVKTTNCSCQFVARTLCKRIVSEAKFSSQMLIKLLNVLTRYELSSYLIYIKLVETRF